MNEQATGENLSITQISNAVESEIRSLHEIIRKNREQTVHFLLLIENLRNAQALSGETHKNLIEAKQQLIEAYESIIPF